MPSLLLCGVLSLAVIYGAANGAKIIMSAPQFQSHIMEQLSLGDELVAKGHEVFVAIGSPYPKMKMESIAKRGMKTLPYKIPSDVLYMASDAFDEYVANTIFNESRTKLEEIQFMTTIVTRDCTYMMNDISFLKQVKQLQFDLAVVEPFFLGLCNSILPYHLGIPFVSMTSFYPPLDVRSPALPSFYPRYFFTMDDQENISFATTLAHLLINLVFEFNFPVRINTNTSLLEQYAPRIPTWKELTRKSELFFYNVDHHLGAPFPSFPNLISIAGMTCRPAKALPTDLENVLQNSRDGVILLSFGSVAGYLPKDITVKFLKAFSMLNQTVLAKLVVPDEYDIAIPKNVKIFKWLPQNDILGHHRTKLFITHCGNNGQHEALYHGVPMLGFPLFAEQTPNSHRGYMKGFGLNMNIHSFTTDELIDNIQEVLDNPKYRTTIKRASEIFRNQPMTAQQTAVFWVEHVIKYGGKHLRSTAMDLPLYQFLMLDIFVFLLAIMAAMICCAKCVIILVVKKIFFSQTGKQKEKLS